MAANRRSARSSAMKVWP